MASDQSQIERTPFFWRHYVRSFTIFFRKRHSGRAKLTWLSAVEGAQLSKDAHLKTLSTSNCPRRRIRPTCHEIGGVKGKLRFPGGTHSVATPSVLPQNLQTIGLVSSLWPTILEESAMTTTRFPTLLVLPATLWLAASLVRADENCSITRPGGVKEPGLTNIRGECCSSFYSNSGNWDDCVPPTPGRADGLKFYTSVSKH
jgi:hypothetical protein